MTSFPHITIDLILYVSVVTDTSFPHITIDLILYVSVDIDTSFYTPFFKRSLGNYLTNINKLTSSSQIFYNRYHEMVIHTEFYCLN